MSNQIHRGIIYIRIVPFCCWQLSETKDTKRAKVWRVTADKIQKKGKEEKIKEGKGVENDERNDRVRYSMDKPRERICVRFM